MNHFRTLDGEGIMTIEEFEKYLTERYQDQVDWYNRKAIRNKRAYNFFQFATIIFTALAAVLGILGSGWERWSAVGLSAFVSLGTSFLLAFRNQELWVKYRSVCETLKKEKYYFQAKVGAYKGHADPMRLFVERVEGLISKDHTLILPPVEGA